MITKSLRFWSLLTLAAFLLAACSPASLTPGTGGATEPPAPAGLALAGTRWVLVSYLAGSGSLAEVIPNSQVTAEFSADQVGGNAGCNSYSGPYHLDGSQLSFGALASTMMACEEPRMQQEADFFAALSRTASAQMAEAQLILLDAQGQTVAVFNPGLAGLAIPETTENPPSDVESSSATPGAVSGQPALVDIPWAWVELVQPNGDRTAPSDPAQYTITFRADSGVKVKADCNLGTGSYTLDGDLLTIRAGIMTLAMCAEGSLGVQFVQYLNAASTYTFEDGSLLITLKLDGGVMKFAPAAAGQ